MSAEFQGGEVFTDVSPGKTVTSTRLNNHVNGGQLLVGAIANRTQMTDPVADGDLILLQDVSDIVTGNPKTVQAALLLPESVRNGSKQYATGTQTGGVYAVTLAPVATTYAAGMSVCFLADSPNTGAVSVNVNGLGNKNIFTRAGAALAPNDILAGQIVELVYDGTRFLMLNALSAAQVTANHILESMRVGATQYITDGGVAANVYAATLSPAATTYTVGMVVRIKVANTNTGASTLNVNGLGAKTIKKRTGADLLANDLLANQVAEFVFDGTNFQLQNPGAGEFVGTGSIPGASAATQIAHGLGAKPTRVRVVLMNNTAAVDLGFAQNDEVDVAGANNSANSNVAFSVSVDATNVTVARTNAGNLQVIPKTGGAPAGFTVANWIIKVYASL